MKNFRVGFIENSLKSIGEEEKVKLSFMSFMRSCSKKTFFYAWTSPLK
jgi:hypothetical protein